MTKAKAKRETWQDKAKWAWRQFMTFSLFVLAVNAGAGWTIDRADLDDGGMPGLYYWASAVVFFMWGVRRLIEDAIEAIATKETP